MRCVKSKLQELVGSGMMGLNIPPASIMQYTLIRCLLVAAMLGWGASAAAESSVKEDIVIIWSPGSSGQDDQSDNCNPWKKPPVLKQFEGACNNPFKKACIDGHRVRIKPYCGSRPTGRYVDPDWDGLPKVCYRADELVAHVATTYRNKDQRFIFLAGHSAGAWASLLVKRAYPGIANGVIAFAPAFAHKRKNRAGFDVSEEFAPRWRWMRDVQVKWLRDEPKGSISGVPATLAFQFHCDEFEWPDELEFMSTRPDYWRILFPDLTPKPEGCCVIKSSGQDNGSGLDICTDGTGPTETPCCRRTNTANCPSGLTALCDAPAHGDLYSGRVPGRGVGVVGASVSCG